MFMLFIFRCNFKFYLTYCSLMLKFLVFKTSNMGGFLAFGTPNISQNSVRREIKFLLQPL